MELLSPSAQRVQDALRGMGFAYEVIEFAQTTRTAAEAAAAVGCTVGQIAKSLVFKTRHGGRPLLVIASGANRVNEKAMRAIVGEPIEKPDADFVRQQTGFVIGGVPPLGHAAPLTIFINEDLLHSDIIWAAAGTPNAVFRLAPADLLPMTGGQAIKVT